MKSLRTVVVLLVFAFAQCSAPDQEPIPLSRTEVLMQDLKQSQVYYELELLNFDLDLGQVEVGEFPHFELVTIPLLADESKLIPSARKGVSKSAILLKFRGNGVWEHFLKVDINGHKSLSDYSDFTGEIILDAYMEGTQNWMTYLEGKFVNYQLVSNEGRKRKANVLARNETEPECQSICHMLDCAGIKFEQRGWIGKLWCAYSIFPCLIGEIIECESEGCANSVYKECGML